PVNSRAQLRTETAIKLIQASEIFKEDGYTLKIWDAYRPLSVQRIMWEHAPLPGYVANPDRGSNHNRGAAVDITLLDEEGNELEMPSGFDDFTENAARDYGNHTSEAKKNMDYMTQVMVSCGFKTIRTEWWHFDDVDSKSYPVLDVGLGTFSP
ncbi:MAG: M15 family metallopeptidase, partial [Clostridiales bacterium]|nr:M15 family metallopeptidase [Clostridiales bacterium]